MNSLSDLKKHFLEHKFSFLLIALLCVGVYFNILDNAFVSDDVQGILENPDLGNLSLALKKLNLSVFLKDLVFLCFGRGVLAYHILSIVLHILATILVYFFILILTENERLSSFATLLFALHPLHTETITWISGRTYALYSVFFLLSFIFYHLSLEKEKRTAYLLSSLVLYTIALFCSYWVLPLLVIFPLYGWYLKGKKFDWRFYLTLAAATAINFFLAYRIGTVGSKTATGAEVGGTHDITVLIPFSITQYLYLLFWPKVLSFYHEGLRLSSDYVFWSRIFTALFTLLLPAILFWRKKKLPLFFLFFFLIAISLSLSPIKVGYYVAERYVYLASISFCVLVAYALLWLEKKLPIKNLALFLLIPILLLYSIRAFVRNEDWQTRASFWAATVRDTPTSYRAHNNLGDVYGWRGDWVKAAKQFTTAIRLKANYVAPRYNLGIALMNMGKFEEAEQSLLVALKLKPDYYQAYFVLGIIDYKQGNLEGAREHWEECLKINPNYAKARQALRTLGGQQ